MHNTAPWMVMFFHRYWICWTHKCTFKRTWQENWHKFVSIFGCTKCCHSSCIPIKRFNRVQSKRLTVCYPYCSTPTSRSIPNGKHCRVKYSMPMLREFANVSLAKMPIGIKFGIFVYACWTSIFHAVQQRWICFCRSLSQRCVATIRNVVPKDTCAGG